MLRSPIKLDNYKPLLPGGVPRLSTQYIIVHCAATKPDMDIGAREINDWHKQRGWRGIGYHYVIRRGGRIEAGRARNVIGAHAKGYNSKSVSVCLVGGLDDSGRGANNFKPTQMIVLEDLLRALKVKYPDAKIIGHRDVEKGKLCPCFDVVSWCHDRGITGV